MTNRYGILCNMVIRNAPLTGGFLEALLTDWNLSLLRMSNPERRSNITTAADNDNKHHRRCHESAAAAGQPKQPKRRQHPALSANGRLQQSSTSSASAAHLEPASRSLRSLPLLLLFVLPSFSSSRPAKRRSSGEEGGEDRIGDWEARGWWQDGEREMEGAGWVGNRGRP